jgi:hypothetical protein
VLGRTTTLHRHADLGADDLHRFWVMVQEKHVNRVPTVEVLGCR